MDRSATLPSRSEPGSPMGSIGTVESQTSTLGSTSGSALTVFVPPLHTIPSDLSDSFSTGSLSHSYPTHHMRTTDDAAVSNQSYLYPLTPALLLRVAAVRCTALAR